jgi:hypothetical protein
MKILHRLLKNTPPYRQPGICGVARILPRVKHGAGLLQRTSEYASLLSIACLIGR